MNPGRASRIALLDRDGTINVDTGYLHDPAELVLAPGAVSGLQALREAGYLLVVVTNQSGISRGYFDNNAFDRLTAELRQRLLNQGVDLAATYHCPHTPDADCACRKPKPAMLHRALADHGIAASRAVMIGDKLSDVAAGHAAGIRRSYRIDAAAPTSGTTFPDLSTCARHIVAEDNAS